VIERLKGDAATDFGVPGRAPSADRRPVDPAEARRIASLLRACWSAFDRVAEGAAGLELRKGPRGGGRELQAIVDHVLDAERAYLGGMGGRYRPEDADEPEPMTGVRRVFLNTLGARIGGHEPPLSGRRKAPLWTPGYAVRRSAWHALDHAWEIEDRAIR
jgi:hypothetical protein